MPIIGLGKIDKKLIPILVGAIFSILTRLLIKFEDTTLFKHKIIPNLISVFSYTFALFPYIILIIRSKNVHYHKNENIRVDSKELIYNDNYIKQIRGKFGYILLNSVLYFIQGILLLYSIKIKSNSWIWEILFTTLFYYLFFKIMLYKHHYISIALIIILGFIIILVFENLQNDISNNLLPLCLRFLMEIIKSLHDVIDKYLMEKKYCSVYEISLFTGLFNLILFTILSIFNYYYLKIDDFEEFINNFNKTEFLVIIGFGIVQLGLCLSFLFTNRENTPCHIFIIAVLGQFANLVDFSTYPIVIIVFLIFLLFLSLIFTEIIEINVCKLSYNTKRNIAKRAEIENLFVEKDTTVSSINSTDENDDKNLSDTNGRSSLESHNINDLLE